MIGRETQAQLNALRAAGRANDYLGLLWQIADGITRPYINEGRKHTREESLFRAAAYEAAFRWRLSKWRPETIFMEQGKK